MADRSKRKSAFASATASIANSFCNRTCEFSDGDSGGSHSSTLAALHCYKDDEVVNTTEKGLNVKRTGSGQVDMEATIGNRNSSTTTPNRTGGELPQTIDSKSRKNATDEQEVSSALGELTLTDGGKPPVPNFRVEGSNSVAGDSLITVGVGSLSTSSSIVLNSSLVKSDNECASLVDSSLGTETETEEPGVTTASTNGDLLSSLQSSEPDEMPLSLVSWYSEPGDCTSACSNSACCGLPSSSTSHCCENGNGSEGHGSKYGANSETSDVLVKSDSQATPTAANVDFLCEEKENKTPGSTKAVVPNSSSSTTATSTTNHSASHIPCRAGRKDHRSKAQCSESQEKDKDSSNKRSQRQKSASCEKPNSKSTENTGSASATESRRKRDKMHVQVFEQKSETNHNSITSVPGHSLVENKEGRRHRERERERLECPRCSRRSKSGSTPPAVQGAAGAPAKSASRRLHHTNSSGGGSHHHHSSGGGGSHMVNGGGGAHQNNVTPNAVSRELKKPIKSILKSESRSGGSGGSGSGSEKQSSMDSLGSNSGVVMTRSDTGPRTKFYINSNDSISYPEDRMVSKLKRIEKYATVRLKKGKSSHSHTNGEHGSADGLNSSADERGRPRTNSETGDGPTADFIPDLMTKSMSFLEKSSTPGTHQSRGIVLNSSGPSSLKRQGSLKIRKPSPGWEPCATRTSALRLLKMQENRAKTGPAGAVAAYGQVASGSTHSGSGESIQNHGTPPTTRHHHHHHHASRSATVASSNTTPSAGDVVKERGSCSANAKVFTKLSSAFGQTASSSMKRLKQEKSVQTENVILVDSITSPVGASASKTSSTSNSPEPLLLNFDAASSVAATATTLDQQTEQIKQLESLVKRYKTSALRFQKEFERTDKKNYELTKQLQENQMESNEMLEFLQAEKSTLAESLVEVETECKKLTRELESVVKESQSRCSSLVRLSEQHKQEALKAQTLLSRLESHTSCKIAAQANQLTQGREAIRGIKSQILCLIETLMKTYKVSQERLTMDGFAESTTGPSKDETELRCTLLLPLIRSLSKAFDAFKIQVKNNEQQAQMTMMGINNHVMPATTTVSSNSARQTAAPGIQPQQEKNASNTNSASTTADPNNTSLEKLNQAIIERENAETVGLDSITNSSTCSKGTTTVSDTTATTDDLSLHDELDQLQVALRKLCTVIRIIVIHCDQKVSNVASDILQVLKSETDKLEFNGGVNNTAATGGLHNGSKIATMSN